MRAFASLIIPLVLLALAPAVSAQSSLSADHEFVTGDVTVTTLSETAISGEFSGDIEGPFTTDIIESIVIETPFGSFGLITGESTIETANGTITTEDHIALIPLGTSGSTFWLGRHFITNAEGDCGVILTLGAFESSEEPFMLHYIGVICTEESESKD